jgi:hypothetical protein
MQEYEKDFFLLFPFWDNDILGYKNGRGIALITTYKMVNSMKKNVGKRSIALLINKVKNH